MARTTRTPIDLSRISLACAEGRHRQCGRQVLLPEPDDTGRMYTVCVCAKCHHVPDYRKHA